MTQQPVNQEAMSADQQFDNFVLADKILRLGWESKIPPNGNPAIEIMQKSNKLITKALTPYQRQVEALTKNYNDMALIYDKELRARQELEGQVALMGEALTYYGDTGLYEYELSSSPFELVPQIIYDEDTGGRARAALYHAKTTIQTHNAKQFNEGVEAAIEAINAHECGFLVDAEIMERLQSIKKEVV